MIFEQHVSGAKLNVFESRRKMESKETELKAFNDIVAALGSLESDQVEAVLKSVITFLGVSFNNLSSTNNLGKTIGSPSTVTSPSFSEERDLTPKQFMLLKQPHTDVERLACLAYYLTHYRENAHFKTIDLSKLNTEAAQPKLSNAAFTARNAVNQGYLAPATKGQKQLSAAGEVFVTNLPDRVAAKEAMSSLALRKKSSKKIKKDEKK